MTDDAPAGEAGGTTAETDRTRSANALKGILWMLLSTLCLASMHSLIHFISDSVHPFIVVFFRLVFALIVVIPFFYKQGLAPLRTKRLGLLVLRGVMNITAMIAFFTALSLVPVTDVTALSFMAPLFATLLAVLVLKEKIGWRRVAAILVGFLGTVIILRPGFEAIGFGYILVIFATFFWGCAVIVIKSLSRTESSVTITTYMSLVMAPLALIPALFVWEWPSATDFFWLVLLGFLGGAGQMAVAQALKNAETHVVMPFDFTRLIWVTIISFTFFAEVPDLFVWIGGSVIFASSAYITLRERKRQLTPTPAAPAAPAGT